MSPQKTIRDIFDTFNEEQRSVVYEIVGQALDESAHDRDRKKSCKMGLTNCKNCGAVINYNTDHCEYCGTNYSAMGISQPTKQSSSVTIDNEVFASFTRNNIMTTNEYRSLMGLGPIKFV